MALMGDPTLRLFPVTPVAQVSFTRSASSITYALPFLCLLSSIIISFRLSWTASTDSVVGYLVYRASDLYSNFTRLSPNFITGTTFTDSAPLDGENVYQVKAVSLETHTLAHIITHLR